jgi:peptidase M20/M25/M40-like protein
MLTVTDHIRVIRVICGVLLLSTYAPSTRGQIRAIDWDKQRAEILQHYRALVQINTSSPPGNETKAVEYLKKVLEAEGIPTKTFALDPNRANLVARLKGNGSKRPLLILAHTDVVPVQVEKWPVDPFGAVIRDGYVWGRGTIDDKDKLVSMLMMMLLVKRSGVVLNQVKRRIRPASASISWSVNISMRSMRSSPSQKAAEHDWKTIE